MCASSIECAGGYSDPSYKDPWRRSDHAKDPAIESLEAAAALGRDPSRAAAHVLEQRQGSIPQYPLRVVTAALSTCHRIVQRHGVQDPRVMSAMHTMFRHLDRRWLEHMNSGSQDTVKGFTNFLVAHSKISVRSTSSPAAPAYMAGLSELHIERYMEHIRIVLSNFQIHGLKSFDLARPCLYMLALMAIQLGAVGPTLV